MLKFKAMRLQTGLPMKQPKKLRTKDKDSSVFSNQDNKESQSGHIKTLQDAIIWSILLFYKSK